MKKTNRCGVVFDKHGVFLPVTLRNLCHRIPPTAALTLSPLSTSYIILLGDFNVEPEESLNMYSLKHLVSQKDCFKNPENPWCIDLILTNCSRSFQNTGVSKTGLSDFYKLTFTVLKQYYPKQKPNVVFYRKYKNFHNDLFRSELENEFSNYDINNME